MTLDHDSSRRAKKARPLVVGERCHVLGPGNKWIDAFITGITDSGRSYETQVEATGKQLTRNRSHIRPRSPDIPHMHASFLQQKAVPSATSDGNASSETENSIISGCQQLANGQKTVISANRKGSIKQTNTSQVLVLETVPDRRVQPSRRAKMTRSGSSSTESTSTSGTDSSSSETSSESSSQPSSNALSPETSSSASTSRSTSPELLKMERSFNSLLAGTRDRQSHPVMRSQMDNLRDQ